MQIKEALSYGQERLEERYEWDNKILDVQLLLAHAMKASRLYVMTHGEALLSEEEERLFLEGLKNREKRMPMAYILGEKEFMGRKFQVAPGVLIPRPDSEVLVEMLLAHMPQKDPLRLLEIGVGSGALILSLLCERPHLLADAIDISKVALQISQKNARSLGCEKGLHLFESNLFQNVKGKYDVIFSNPPYISLAEEKDLAPDLAYEPKEALYAEEEGLYFYRRILEEAKHHLKKGGLLAFEIGKGQENDICEMARQEGYGLKAKAFDLQNINRALLFSGESI